MGPEADLRYGSERGVPEKESGGVLVNCNFPNIPGRVYAPEKYLAPK
jgi:hypothetical protein